MEDSTYFPPGVPGAIPGGIPGGVPGGVFYPGNVHETATHLDGAGCECIHDRSHFGTPAGTNIGMPVTEDQQVTTTLKSRLCDTCITFKSVSF